MPKQRVSVIIPTRRSVEILERAIGSVRNQSYSPFEIIVVHEEASDYPRRITEDPIIKMIKNSGEGVSGARNYGIRAAGGDLLAFLDDDDRWQREKIRKQTMRLEDSEDTVLGTYTGVRQIGKDGEINAVKTPTVEPLDLLRGNPIGTFSAFMVRRSAIDAVGLLDENLRCWEDWDYYLRLIKEGELVPIKRPMVDRFSGHGQLSDEYTPKLDAADILMEKHADFASKFPRGESIFRAGLERELGKSAFQVEDYPAARRHLSRSCTIDPSRMDSWVILMTVMGGKYTFKPAQWMKRQLSRMRHMV